MKCINDLDSGPFVSGLNDVKSISIEINENFVDQYDAIHKLMKEYNFVFKHKKHNKKFSDNDGSFSKTYNYVFEKRAHDVLMDK